MSLKASMSRRGREFYCASCSVRVARRSGCCNKSKIGALYSDCDHFRKDRKGDAAAGWGYLASFLQSRKKPTRTSRYQMLQTEPNNSVVLRPQLRRAPKVDCQHAEPIQIKGEVKSSRKTSSKNHSSQNCPISYHDHRKCA